MIEIDARSAVPVYDQIREQIAALVGSGQLETGVRLPSIRQLAGDLRVAAGTVARAYAELEAAGLILSSRGGGTRVSGGRRVDDDLLRAAAQLADLARRRSLQLDDALGAVRAAWAIDRSAQPAAGSP